MLKLKKGSIGYLAGPIEHVKKDGIYSIDEYDISWRKYVISAVDSFKFLDPINHSKFNIENKDKLNWDKVKIEIYKQDKNLIDESDFCIANINKFSDYPCIGTLVEIGIFIEKKKPVLLVSNNYEIINNPLLSECITFRSLNELLKFLIT